MELDQGFKYLGFFIKAGFQRNEEWGWLIKKLEKKISIWCYRCLSIGVRFTLLKAVLESQPIYWLSLAVVPSSILNSLRKIMYHFLWRRNNESHQIHLCRWEQIVLTKSFGGWGIHNIFDFCKSLAANTLWRVLNGNGIWHRVICDKYIHEISVITWLRSSSFQVSRVSRIWSGLVKVIHLITHGLFWILGNGSQIALGKDGILGMGN
jgi:hypothetical protein